MRKLVVVPGEANVIDISFFAKTAGIGRIDECPGQLDGPVLAVVGMDDAIAVGHTAVSVDHVGQDVLIEHVDVIRRLVAVVRLSDGVSRTRRISPFAVDNAVVRNVGQLPILRPVHGVVPAHKRSDRTSADLGQDVVQFQ